MISIRDLYNLNKGDIIYVVEDNYIYPKKINFCRYINNYYILDNYGLKIELIYIFNKRKCN